jgi:hypothetical protein
LGYNVNNLALCFSGKAQKGKGSKKEGESQVCSLGFASLAIGAKA